MSRIDEIRERLARATPGPWRMNDVMGAISIVTPDDCVLLDYYAPTRQNKDNAILMGNAHSDISYLLGEVERLRKVIEDAPHQQYAGDVSDNCLKGKCDCWKSEAMK